jgi:NADH-quinone oxidoreductase subunit E
MLNEIEMKEIKKRLVAGSDAKEAVLDLLKIVQKSRGWVPDDAVEDIAEQSGLSTADIESIATFYSLIYRKPVGMHVILICDSMSCWLTGYDDLLNHLTKTLGIGLGETTSDGKFTLLPSACLGVCEEAPAMMINETLYTKLTTTSIDAILESYRT